MDRELGPVGHGDSYVGGRQQEAVADDSARTFVTTNYLLSTN